MGRIAPKRIGAGAGTLAAFALASAAAVAQQAGREARSFVVPPPSATSTGGAPSAMPPPLHGAPRLRGRTLETKDVLHADEVELIGLEQTEQPYRADLGLDRTPLGANADPDATGEDSDLHRRQLAIFSGARATRFPEVVHAPTATVAADAGSAGAPPGRSSTCWAAAAVVGLVVSLFAVHRKLSRVD